MAALENGRASWTAVLDAVRLEPGADVAATTTVQLREVVEQLVAVGQWKPGDPEILVMPVDRRPIRSVSAARGRA